MRDLKAALAFILFMGSCCAYAHDVTLDVDQYAHTAWKVRDGFGKGAIYSIAQTPDGYLWLGTEFGLLRFDGVDATSWQPPPGESLPSETILKLLVTRDGRLWIGTDKGLASWKDKTLTTYTELAGRAVNTLLEDKEGTLWVGGKSESPDGVLCAIQNDNVRCDERSSQLRNGVVGLFEGKGGNLWIGVQNGIWRWRPGPPKFYSVQDEPLGGFAEDDNGALLIGTRKGIKRLADGKVEPFDRLSSIRPFSVFPMRRDRDGSLWIGTLNQGLIHLHDSRIDEFSLSDGLSGDIVYALFTDREGNRWVATSQGLDRFRNLAVVTFSGKQGLLDPIVACVLGDRDGSVWIATYGGLNRSSNGQITNYGEKDRTFRGHAPNSLLQDHRGRVWVSTRQDFGYLANGRFVTIPGIPGNSRIHGTAEDIEQNIWVANPEALYRLSSQGLVEQIPWRKLRHTDSASAIAADPSRGGIWLGFASGGVSYFRDGQIQASYSTVNGLGAGEVTRFEFDSDGTVWVATEGGLSRIKNGRAATLTSKSGLPCDAVQWVIEDNDRSFWLYAPCGLIRISRSELEAWGAEIDRGLNSARTIHADTFDISDGVRALAGPGLYNPQVTKSVDGKLWFFRWDGVSVIDPRHIPFNPLPPPVHIKQILAAGKTYNLVSATDKDVRLPALIRNVQVDYTALSFVDTSKVLFRYKLEGYDKDWQEVGTRRQAFYTDLPPGTYRFRVIACNNSGVWNEAGASVGFSVPPAWFQTNWFRFACAAAFLTVMWGLYEIRLHQLRRQFSVRLEARVTERTRIARELHDTLLQSLHGLMFEFQAVRNMFQKRPEDALLALDSALIGTEQAITESQNAIENLRNAAACGEDLAQLVKMTGESLLASQHLDHDRLTFGLTVEGHQRMLTLAVRDEIYNIAREVLRNAFRHAQARRIEAEILYESNQLRFRVRDDGKGMEPQVINKGGRPGHWGLPGIRERAQLIGATLDIWSEVGAGTEVQLTVAASVAYQKISKPSGFRVFKRTKS
jgi:ligand-binding sensor domain-containing protein/signal transduction histidine kinase